MKCKGLRGLDIRQLPGVDRLDVALQHVDVHAGGEAGALERLGLRLGKDFLAEHVQLPEELLAEQGVRDAAPLVGGLALPVLGVGAA